jgi:hypothetical protein
MAYTVKDNGADFKRPEAGWHIAICSHLVDLGIQDGQFGQKKQCALIFELDEKREDGKSFQVAKTYNESLNIKSNLRHDLENWRGQKLTEEEVKGFDLEKIVGVPAYLNLMDDVKGEKTYTKIVSIGKLPKGMSPIPATNLSALSWVLKMADKGKKLEMGVPPSDMQGEEQTAEHTIGSSDDLPF